MFLTLAADGAGPQPPSATGLGIVSIRLPHAALQTCQVWRRQPMFSVFIEDTDPNHGCPRLMICRYQDQTSTGFGLVLAWLILEILHTGQEYILDFSWMLSTSTSTCHAMSISLHSYGFPSLHLPILTCQTAVP